MAAVPWSRAATKVRGAKGVNRSLSQACSAYYQYRNTAVHGCPCCHVYSTPWW